MLLEKQAKKQMTESKNDSIKRVKAIKNAKDIMQAWYLKQLLTKRQIEKLNAGELTMPEVKKIMIAKIEKDFTKDLEKRLNQIKNLKQNDFVRFAKCEIDWRRSNTWGWCPAGCYRNGFKYQEYRSVTGCGYDKLSTLTAQMFNEDVNLMAYIMQYVEKHAINKDNIRNKLGYGIGISNGKIYFDVWHASTKSADIIEISRKTKNNK